MEEWTCAKCIDKVIIFFYECKEGKVIVRIRGINILGIVDKVCERMVVYIVKTPCRNLGKEVGVKTTFLHLGR